MKINNLLDLVKVRRNSEKGIIFIKSVNLEKFVSYKELIKNSFNLLKNLKNINIEKNSKLIFQLEDNEHFVYSFWACILGGIIPIPLTCGSNESYIKKLLKIYQIVENSKILISKSQLNNLMNFPDFLNQIKKDDILIIEDIYKENYDSLTNINLENNLESNNNIAFIQFSSGSTGDPKGVVLSHTNLVANISGMSDCAEISSSDSMLSWMPLTHDMGLIGGHLLQFYNDSNQFLMPPSLFVRYPVVWIEKISEHQVTMTTTPNFGINYFLKAFKQDSVKSLNLSALRLIYNGAEPISLDLCDKFTDILKSYGLRKSSMYTVYGMAESCLAVTFPKPNEEYRKVIVDRFFLNISDTVKYYEIEDVNTLTFADEGFPVTNCLIRICNNSDEIVKESIVGHIQISGKNVTSGYYNNIKATKESFTKDGWLKTGDIGFIRDGRLVVTGRTKDVIFINGQNFYAHDLESIVYENVKTIEFGKIVFTNVENKILAFAEYKQDINTFIPIISEIKEHIFRVIGIEIFAIIPIKKIPKTTSGKVQRFFLQQLYIEGSFNSIIESIERQKPKDVCEKSDRFEYYDEPTTKLKNILLKILNSKEIDIKKDFVYLGLNSIRIIKLVEEIKKEFEIELSLNDIIISSNIINLSKLISSKEKCKSHFSYSILSNGNDCNSFPLSDIQTAYLLGRDKEYLLGGISTYAYYEFNTSLDINELNQALNKIIERHPMLRTKVSIDGSQRVLDCIPKYTIKVENISEFNCEEYHNKINEERNRISNQIISLNQWPYFEFKALKIRGNHHLLLIGFDLIIADGMSLMILFKELMHYYEDLNNLLPELELSFKDYILYREDIKKSEIFRRDKQYWLNKIETFPTYPNLPLKTKPETIENILFKRKDRCFGSKEREKIKIIVKKNQITQSVFFCSIYAHVLSYWSNQFNFALNMTFFNRYPIHKDIDKLIGDFTSLLFIEINLNPLKNFWENTTEIQKIVFESLNYGNYNGIDFLRELAKKNNQFKKQLMPIVFTSLLFEDEDFAFFFNKLGELQFGLSRTPQVFLDFQIIDRNDEFYISIDYLDGLFDDEVVEGIIENIYKSIFQVIDGSMHLNNGKLSSNIEIIQKFNSTETLISESEIHKHFIRQVSKNPNSIAVVSDKNQLTYKELHEKSNQVSRYLISKGVQRNDLVALIASRDFETIINVLAILKSGAAYVPIDPGYPESRKVYIIKDCNCKEVLSKQLYYNENIAEFPKEYEKIPEDYNSLAYIIYTSGSTGTPKGVAISHKAANNTIVDINTKFKITNTDRIPGISSICFDLSVFDIFGTFSVGAAMVIVKSLTDISELYGAVIKNKITIWNSVPAIMNLFIENIKEKTKNSFKLPFLRLIMLSGDWIPINLPTSINSICPNCEIISLGGATEASIWSIYYPIKHIEKNWNSIPYGFPLANQQFYVLNYNKEICPNGTSGELYIGGFGLAEGYVNSIEKTDDTFINHPKLGILYKTGDIGSFRKDGYIEFLGRIDQQVKVFGFRIELGEIETTLNRLESIKTSIVVVKDDNSGKKRLVAYIIPTEESKELNIEKLRQDLSKTLPDYMVPSLYVKLDTIPLTQNGKLNKNALPSPEDNLETTNKYLAPFTEVEMQLATIWRELLGLEKIGIYDNFFELGGNSILAQKLVNRLNGEYSVGLKIHDFLINPTISNLRIYFQKIHKKLVKIISAEKLEYYPLTSVQQRLYTLHQMNPKSLAYNTPFVYKYNGNIDIAKLKDSINKLMLKHQVLKTYYIIVNNQVVQSIKLDVIADIKTIKCTIENINEVLKSNITPFDLTTPPLFKIRLFTINETEGYLLIDSHHLLSDHYSLNLIINDLNDLYNFDNSTSKNEFQIFDYALFENNYLVKNDMIDNLKYWEEKYKNNLRKLELPSDLEIITTSNEYGNESITSFTIEEDVYNSLRILCKNENLTLFNIFSGIVNILLSIITGKEQILIGTIIMNRPYPDLANIIGMFANTLILQNFVNSNDTVKNVIDNIKNNFIESIDHQIYSYNDLITKIGADKDVIEVMLVVQNNKFEGLNFNNVKLEQVPISSINPRFDLTFEVIPFDNEILINVEYTNQKFKKETIDFFIQLFKNITNSLFLNYYLPISELNLYNKEESLSFQNNLMHNANKLSSKEIKFNFN